MPANRVGIRRDSGVPATGPSDRRRIFCATCPESVRQGRRRARMGRRRRRARPGLPGLPAARPLDESDGIRAVQTFVGPQGRPVVGKHVGALGHAGPVQGLVARLLLAVEVVSAGRIAGALGKPRVPAVLPRVQTARQQQSQTDTNHPRAHIMKLLDARALVKGPAASARFPRHFEHLAGTHRQSALASGG